MYISTTMLRIVQDLGNKGPGIVQNDNSLWPGWFYENIARDVNVHHCDST